MCGLSWSYSILSVSKIMAFPSFDEHWDIARISPMIAGQGRLFDEERFAGLSDELPQSLLGLDFGQHREIPVKISSK